jgi:hypothetical protein
MKAELVIFSDDGERWGICNASGTGLLYDADFRTPAQARAICDAHNKGAESYEQACAMAGLDPVTLEALAHPSDIS